MPLSINFDRNRVQVYLEKLIDSCYDPFTATNSQKKVFRDSAMAHTLTLTEVTAIQPLQIKDACDFFYNAVVSFCDAISGLLESNYSWSTIQLYYTVYYLLRCYINLKGYAFFHACKFFYIKNCVSQSFTSIPNSHTTHDFAINVFKTEFGSNYILSNSVDGQDSLDWIKELREITNYRARAFLEPAYYEVYTRFSSKTDLENSIENVMTDRSLAFQSDYAMLGLPILLFQDINSLGKNSDLQFNSDRLSFLKDNSASIVFSNDFKQLLHI